MYQVLRISIGPGLYYLCKECGVPVSTYRALDFDGLESHVVVHQCHHVYVVWQSINTHGMLGFMAQQEGDELAVVIDHIHNSKFSDYTLSE